MEEKKPSRLRRCVNIFEELAVMDAYQRLNPKEAADYLGISVSAIYRIVSRHRAREGSKTLIVQADYPRPTPKR